VGQGSRPGGFPLPHAHAMASSKHVHHHRRWNNVFHLFLIIFPGLRRPILEVEHGRS